jgi:hypothetical protein
MMCATLLGVSLIAASITALPCGQCHRAEAARFSETGMANALVAGAQSQILKSHPKLSFRQGPFSYLIERRGNQSWYTVADGNKQITLPVEWAFGLGAAGQTYIVRLDDSWIESRVSYYREIDGLDLTVGAHPEVPGSLEEALGRTLSKHRVSECFDCHATGALSDGILHTELLTAGVQCQRCHDGVDAHVAALQHSGAAKVVVPRRLSQLTTEEMSEFCGQCHRTWVQIASEGPHDVNNVRFQPYRLTNSKCYDATDSRIQCTACHDPHTEVVHGASAYDSRCLACHSGKTSAKVCTSASANCVSCHMAKVRLPDAHLAFTDHWIRIVKPGQPYPR